MSHFLVNPPKHPRCCLSPTRTDRPGTMKLSALALTASYSTTWRLPTYLAYILIPNAADLLDVGGTLRHILQRIPRELYLIFLVLGDFNVHTWVHSDSSNDLLSNEIPVTVRSIGSQC